MLTVVACYRELGDQVEDFRLDPTGRFFKYTLLSPAANPFANSQICERDRGHGYLVYLWEQLNAPGVERRMEAEALVAECMDDRGHEDMPVLADPTFSEWLTTGNERLSAFDACIEEVAAETGVRVGG